MGKGKKQNFKNFWNKVKKPLFIVSLIFNVLFFSILFVSCATTKKQKVQAKAEEPYVATLRETSWLLNRTLPDTPRGSWNPTPEENYTYDVEFTTAYSDRVYTGLNFYRAPSLTYSKLSYVNSNVQDRAYSPIVEYWDHDEYRTITFGSVGNQIRSLELIDWLFDNATLLSQPEDIVFIFNKYFNYNAPFAMNTNSMFINSTHTQKTYYFPTFISNGEYFDAIKLYYVDGVGTEYELDNGGTSTNTNSATGYYLEMEYLNTRDNISVPVNYRSFKADYSSGGLNTTSTFLVKGSYWVNDSYRNLYFLNELTPEERTSLSQFNSEFDVDGFSSTTSNIGLQPVFGLFSTAFGAFTNIFRIEILPGISLGLLIFMPLIVIVIMVIIKLVKR